MFNSEDNYRKDIHRISRAQHTPPIYVIVELAPDLHLGQLTLDKGNSLCTILGSVALVGCIVTAVAAIRVRGVAV